MFNFSNALFVGPSLFSFLPFVALAECRCSVCLCKRVENSDVKVGLLVISSPEICCNNIEAGAFFSVGCSVAQLLSCDWLKVRFSADIVAYFLHHFCCDVSEFIVSDLRKSSSRAAKCMFDSKLLVADAVRWEVWWVPAVPEIECVSECSFMEGRVVSQLDAPFSVAASMALFRVGGSFSLVSFASLASCCLRSV